MREHFDTHTNLRDSNSWPGPESCACHDRPISLGRALDTSTPSLESAQVLALQRSVGNQAVQRILSRRAERRASGAPPSAASDTTSLSELGARDPNGVAEGAEIAIDHAASSNGEPLPSTHRNIFERSLGADLSPVRIHTGKESAVAAAAVGAKAYTIGQDIHFGASQYDPTNPTGAHLLAHEVAHTVQHHGVPAMHQSSLDVSTPSDPSEIEADRAADAMVSGTSYGIEGTAPAVHRQSAAEPQPAPSATPAPQTPTAVPNPTQQPAATTPTAATPGATPTPTPGTTPVATNPNASTVQSSWFVQWSRKTTDTPVTNKSNARTGKDSASGTLKIMPQGTGPKSTPGWSIIPWMNAASSGGPVEVGTVAHPSGVGGTVSTGISCEALPSAKAQITIDPEVKAAANKDALRELQKDLPAKQKAASDVVSRQLKVDLESMGTVAMIEEDLNAAVASAVGGDYKATVHVTQAPGTTARPAESPVSYEAVTAGNSKRTVNIMVPTKVEELKGNTASEIATHDLNKVNEKTGRSETTTTDVHTDITTSFIESFKNTYMKLVETAKHNSTSLSGSAGLKVGGSVSAGAAFKDLTIDLGSLLAAVTIEDPPLAFLLKKAIGTMTTSGDLKTTLGGDLNLSADASKSWSDDDVQKKLTTHKDEMEKKIATNFSTTIQKTVNDTYSRETDNLHDVTRKGASSSETIQVNFVVSDQPILNVISEADHPAAP